jgi:multidrug efflux pump subunit AcrB
MVLAIGIVVDDAIVVVENVERHMNSGRAIAQGCRQESAMDEV